MSTHGYICEHRECNGIVSFLCPSPSVFSPLMFFIWLPTASSGFFPPPSSLHLLSLRSSSSSSFLSFTPSLFGGFLSFLPLLPPPPPPAGCGDRKLVDCPQLLDVDDMVKMREPDWKCVYTYLQEFYRGLVTKGLVKTKNS